MRWSFAQLARLAFCPLLVCLLAPRIARAQEPTPDKPNSEPAIQETSSSPEDSDSSDVLTVFPHSDTAPFWFSGQANVVLQWHPTFRAKYTGPNSLTAPAQSATTHILTFYAGYQLTQTTEVFLNVEYATGGGVGTALGLAGYTNLDSVRTVQGVALSKAPYLARAMVRQIIPLSDERVKADRDPLHQIGRASC